MKFRRAALFTSLFLLMLSMASQSYADISNAAVLFLRIAPGARAASMGEAFVAVADDATATHYNPAGLGASPLSKNWIDAKIPSQYRPLNGMAAMRARGGSTYLSYDIWALTAKGLLRFDNRKWQSGDVRETQADDTMEKLVSRYYSITDKDSLQDLVLTVAAANSPESYESVTAFRDSVMALVPKDYKNTKQLQTALDSLVQLYPQCRINWEYMQEARSRYADAKKGGTVTETKLDRITFAVERTRNRFVPENVTMPYSARIKGQMTSIASMGDAIVVGSTTGLYSYNGRIWHSFGAADGLPSDSVLNLRSVGSSIFVGTTQGPSRFNGSKVSPYSDSTGVPKGRVQAIGGDNPNSLWAVVDNDLYHFDGSKWSNLQPYTVALDDTPEKIAANHAVYGSAVERALYLKKLRGGSDSGAYPAMTAGSVIGVPYLAELKGKVNAIASGMNKLWIGTEYGIIYLDKDKWMMPGYREVTVDSARTVADYAAQYKDMTDVQREAFAKTLKTLNDIPGDTIPAGSILKSSKKPVPEVADITRFENSMMFATTDGLVEYDGMEFRRSDFRGVSSAPARDLSLVREKLWVAGDDRIVTSSQGRSELSLMYVKWLPDLAPDLYYSFLSFVKPTNNWGTFGGNITYISYGKFSRTGSTSPDVISEFQSFDIAISLAYGNSITNRLKGGVGAKLIYSKLADQGAGAEKGKGTSTGFALDFGLLYQWTPRLNIGVALTNVGPKMAYIDANQADDLPRNLGVGFAYKVLQGTYTRLVYSAEINKLMVGLNQGFTEELKQTVINTGAEFTYANLISGRAGYIYDQEGKIKVATIGMGLNPIENLKFDVSWVPNGQNVALNNTLRYSLSFVF